MEQSAKINNILIIKPGAIGDTLQLTPVVRAIKIKHPGVNISLLVGSDTTALLFKHNPYVRETIVYDKQGKHGRVTDFIKLWRALRKNKYDLVINFQRSNLKTWFLSAAAFPCRVLVYHKARNRTIHAVANYLETVASLGVYTANLDLELMTGAADKERAARIVSSVRKKSGPLVIVNPGASHSVNRWGAGRFASLVDMLAQELSADVIIIGGNDDLPLAEEIIRKSVSKPVLMAGKLNLLQLGALLERCDALVSGDTGPMHVATAVGTRVVALFGAADPARTGPVGPGHKVLHAEGVSCVPCRKRKCNNTIIHECMERLSVDMVYNAIAAVTKKRPS